MPFAFHCKICDLYEIGDKPFYTFTKLVDRHFIEIHPDVILQKKPTLLIFNSDFKIHQPIITDHEQGNEYQPQMKKYSEQLYSMVTIGDRLFFHLRILTERDKNTQRTLKTYLNEWFGE